MAKNPGDNNEFPHRPNEDELVDFMSFPSGTHFHTEIIEDGVELKYAIVNGQKHLYDIIDPEKEELVAQDTNRRRKMGEIKYLVAATMIGAGLLFPWALKEHTIAKEFAKAPVVETMPTPENYSLWHIAREHGITDPDYMSRFAQAFWALNEGAPFDRKPIHMTGEDPRAPQVFKYYKVPDMRGMDLEYDSDNKTSIIPDSVKRFFGIGGK